jgi:hypothetical protein
VPRRLGEAPLTGLLANWRLAAFLALVAALGVQTYRVRDIQADLEAFRHEVEAAGREAAAAAKAKDAHNQLVKEELEDEIKHQAARRALERADRDREREKGSDRFAAVYGKYLRLLDDPGGGGVPQAGPSPAEPVQPKHACFDAQRFAAGIRRDLDWLYREVESLLRRGEDGIDDRQHWGQWARLTGACLKP